MPPARASDHVPMVMGDRAVSLGLLTDRVLGAERLPNGVQTMPSSRANSAAPNRSLTFSLARIEET